MSSLSLKHIYKVYDGNVKAVNDFSMDIEDKEFIVFVGPSGCGKSTTLRMIAGLEEITAGELRIDGEIVNDKESKDRNIAMVFQNYALYPHMTVYENMGFALKIAKVPKEEIDKKVRAAAEILDITDYLDRKPKALSGGQRQRVALGRAIVRNPKVFLLDEPLSNLDAKLRANMRAEITRLHNQLQTTFIYVTHDQIEAMTMGTRIVVMKAGFVQQIDTPQNLYKYPANVFVAGFIGTPQMNFFDGIIQRVQGGAVFKLENGVNINVDYSLVNKIHERYFDGAHPVIVGVRPEDIKLFEKGLDETLWQKTQATVDFIEALGGETLLHCKFDPNEKDELVVKVVGECFAKVGDPVDIAINKKNLHVFDKETEERINVRIPEVSTLNVTVDGNIMNFAQQKLELHGKIADEVQNGEYTLTVPSNAITLGHGSINAVIKGKEQINNKNLYELDIDGNVVFAVDDSLADFSLGNVSCSIDMARVTLTGTSEIKPLALVNELDGTFIKVKEKSDKGKKTTRYYIKIGEQRIHSPYSVSEKLFLCKGVKTFKTPFGYIFGSDAVIVYPERVQEDMLEGTIKEILDYGEKLYAEVIIENTSVNVEIDEGFSVGDKVYIAINYDKLSVKDNEIDMLVI